MTKNTMDDMIKIKIIKKNTTIKKVDKDYSKKILKIPPTNKHKKHKKEKIGPRYMLWFIAFISLIFFFFAFSYMFSKANIRITPKIENLIINENLSAEKDSNSSPISFDLVVISGEENKKVETKSKEYIELKAIGDVIIYNTFSTKPQTLNIDTRLEGSNGKMYKTKKRIVIPGMSKDEPGKIEVGIYGAEAGEEYNSEPLDFKIFGFKNTSKYSKFYARSKGDIIGGIKGDFYTINPEEEKQIINDLKNSLQIKLLKRVTEQIPKGFIFFEDGIFLSINNENISSFSNDSLVPISIKGTLYGFLFEEKKLTKKIAEDVIDKYDGSDVYIANIKDLSFILTDKEDISFSDVKNINFTLSGASKMVWNFDVDKLINELLDKKKKDFNSILSKYPNVISSNLNLKPFWRRSFPNKIQNIKVIVNYPK